MKRNEINMLEGSLWDKILLFAIPLAAGSILQQLFNSADIAVVGQFVGSKALAAVGANSQVINLVINLFVGLSIGTNVILANFLGQGNEERVARVIHTSVLVAVISGLFLAVVGNFLARPIMMLISTPTEILDDAVLYLKIYFGGMPFVMLYNFSAAILRSKGDTRRPLLVLLVSGAVNVALNLFFVLMLHMTVDGVALATVLSHAVSAIVLVFLLTQEEGAFRLNLRRLRIDWSLLGRMAAIGIPAGFQGMMFSISNVLLQSAINSLGSDAIAATADSLNYEYFVVFLMQGFTNATTTFVGQNYGAGNLPRCRKVLRWSLLLSEVCVYLMVSVFVIFRIPFALIFTKDLAVAELAAQRMFIILLPEFFNIAMEMVTAAMRGMGYSVRPTLSYLIGICGLRIVWVFWVFPHQNSFGQLMLVYPISWIVTLSIAIGLYVFIMKKHLREYATEEPI